MQEIEREIIDQVRGRGAQIDAKNFSWNRGHPLAKLPSGSVYMEVRVGSKQAIANWERTQLEDCWDRVDRPEVRQEIERIVEILAPARIPRPTKPFEVK
jgi:hypothetical protein